MASRSSSDHSDPVSTMGIKLVELETFLAVAQTGSFSLAAERLHVSQPSVTSRVQRLEAILGTRLLERTTRRVELTAQGKLLADQAEVALRGLMMMVDDFRKQAHQARQRVVVVATPTLAALTLPPIIRAYSDRYPDVGIELLDLQYDAALAALDSGAADLAIMALEEAGTRYRFEHLWSEQLVLVVPVGHRLAGQASAALEELSRYPLMMVGQYLVMRSHLSEALAERGLSLPSPSVVGNLSTLLGMLNAGMGIGLVPRIMAHRCESDQVRIIELEDVDLHREYGLVLTRKAELSSAGESFMRFMRSTGKGVAPAAR